MGIVQYFPRVLGSKKLVCSRRATQAIARGSLSPTPSPLEQLDYGWRSERDSEHRSDGVPCLHIRKSSKSKWHICRAPLQRQPLLNAVGGANCHLSCTRQPPASPQVQTIYRDYTRSSKQMNQNSLHLTEAFRAGNRLKDQVAVSEHWDFSLKPGWPAASFGDRNNLFWQIYCSCRFPLNL